MDNIHRSLKLQLQKYFVSENSIPPECRDFIQAVNKSYWESDTDRYMLERSLELSSKDLIETNTELLSILQTLPDLLLRLDYDGTIIDYKSGQETNLFYFHDDFTDKKIQDIMADNIGKMFFDAIKQLKQQHEPVSIEYSLTISDNAHYFEARLLPLRDNQIIAIIRNMNEIKKTEERIKKQSNFLQNILSNIPHFIFWKDKQSAYLGCNENFALMAGLDNPNHVIGKTDYDLPWKEEQTDFFRKCDQKVIDNGEELLNIEESLLQADGLDSTLLTSKVPLKNSNGEIYGLLGISTNITDRKRAEKELKNAIEMAQNASQAKSEFLANMSHELRTPLNAIIGLTDITLSTELTQSQYKYLEMSKSSANSLLNILNDILDFSKIEAGKLDFNNVKFSLRDTLGNTMKSFSVQASQKEIELISHVPPDIPTALIGDPGRLRQILVNLVGNAIKFTEKGGEIKLYVQEKKPGYNLNLRKHHKIKLIFSVSDTGIGILPEKQQMIFDSFTQVDSSTTRKFGGTGLGLAISKQLTEMMAGKIWVESKLNKGSTFHFSACFELQKPLKKQTVVKSCVVLRNYSVIVVEDNETNRFILEEMLANWEIKPTIVADGKAALKIMYQYYDTHGKAFDLALIDVRMPGMDGFELTKEIKKASKFDNTKIIILTSSGQRGDASLCNQLGISGYLLKPVAMPDLHEAILAVLTSKFTPEDHQPLITRHSLRENRRRLRVLVAEDSKVNQIVITEILENQGHHVEIAQNGKKALAILEKDKFDLILMDIQMPEMDGLETTRLIRLKEEDSQEHIPIIAITAHAFDEDRERCLEAGMDDYLSKPIKLEQLIQAIDKYKTDKETDHDIDQIVEAKKIPVVNTDEVLSKMGGKKKIFIKIANLFLEKESPNLMSEIHKAINLNHADNLMRSAHGLKGVISNFEAQAAYEAAFNLEKLGREGDLSRANELYQILVIETEKLRVALTDLINDGNL